MFLKDCAAVLGAPVGGFCARAERKPVKSATASRKVQANTGLCLRMPITSVESTAKDYQNRRVRNGKRFAQLVLLGVYVATLCERSDAVGGAECERFDGHCRLAAAGGDEAAAVAEENVFHVVGAMVRIDDGSLWIVAHAAGAKEMDGKLLLFDGVCPFLLCACGVEDLQAIFVEPFGELDIVGVIFVSHAQRRKAPGVFDFRIERKAVLFLRQRSAVGEDFNRAREVVRNGVLEFLAPARSVGRETAAGSEVNRRHVKACVEAAAAVKTDFLRIELVEIMEYATHGETFVVVELLIKEAERNSAGVEHEILADVAAGVGEAVGELFGSGK